jgi:pantothenate kinase
MMKDSDFETCFLVNETQAPLCISYGDRQQFIVYARDCREVQKKTWRAACKRSPQLLDMVKVGDLRVLTMPEDVNEIMQIVEKLDNLSKAKQMEIERMSPEEQALAFQQKRRADYDSYGNPHVVAASKEIV